MTESEWLAGDDPEALCAVVSETTFRTKYPAAGTERKRSFFGAACCRLVWPWVAADDRCRRVVEHMEEQFDRAYSDDEVDDLYGDCNLAARHPNPGTPVLQMTAANLVLDAHYPATTVRYLVRGFEDWGDPCGRARQVAAILRDIVGNPFRPVAADPRWLTSTALALAENIYAERAFDRLPILADALEDAGCDAADLLAHCRGPGPHVRGCWAVDLVLGKG